MPLIAYQGPHGANDYPLHFSFFEALDRRGLLNKFDFALDPLLDLDYCRALISRFPQLTLVTQQSLTRKLAHFVHRAIGRGIKSIAKADYRFDAVCEAPGGRITSEYVGEGNLFWAYPRVKHRAILFHSIDQSATRITNVARSLAATDLIIARTSQSAQNARMAGAANVVTATDIVFQQNAVDGPYKEGLAVALRVSRQSSDEYLKSVRGIIQWLCHAGSPVDFVRVEEPIGCEMSQSLKPHSGRGIGMAQGNDMYLPFVSRRDAIISCRLHTTLLAILNGNRRIQQFQIEPGTSKIREVLADLEFDIPTLTPSELTRERLETFLHGSDVLPAAQVQSALQRAHRLVEQGLDAFEDWLYSLSRPSTTRPYHSLGTSGKCTPA